MKKGIAVIEYTVVIIMFVLAIIASQQYILRALSGYWRNMGDTFGFGKQYCPGGDCVGSSSGCIPEGGDCPGAVDCCPGLTCGGSNNIYTCQHCVDLNAVCMMVTWTHAKPCCAGTCTDTGLGGIWLCR